MAQNKLIDKPEIREALGNLLEQNRKSYSSIKGLADDLNKYTEVKYGGLKSYKKELEQMGFSFNLPNNRPSILDKKEVKDVLNSLIENNETTFTSATNFIETLNRNGIKISDSAIYSNRAKLKEMGFNFKTNKTHTTDDSLIEAIEKLDKTKLYSPYELSKLLNKNDSFIYSNKGFFKDKGIKFKQRHTGLLSKSSFLNFIENMIKEGDTEFKSKAQLTDYLIINLPNLEITADKISKLHEFFKEKGFTFNFKSVDTIFTKNKKKLEEFIRNGEIEYTGMEQLAKILGLTGRSLSYYKNDLEEMGFKFIPGLARKHLNRKQLEDNIKKLVDQNKLDWSGIPELAKALKVSIKTIKDNKEFLDKNGITTSAKLTKQTAFIKKLQELLKTRTIFKSYKDLSVALGYPSTKLTSKDKEDLESYGIIFDPLYVDPEEKQEIINKLNLLKEDGLVSFESIGKAAEELNLQKKSFEIRYLPILEENNIFIDITNNRKVSVINQNYTLLCQKLKEEEILIENVEAFKDIGKSYFRLPINVPNSQVEPILVVNQLIKNASQKELTDYIKSLILSLTLENDTAEFTIDQIKFMSLQNNFYLSENTIRNTLKLLLETHSTDSVLSRLELANLIAKNSFITVEFEDELPDINSNINSLPILHKSIKNNAYNLWKEYVLYLLERKLLPVFILNNIANETNLLDLNDFIEKNNNCAKALFLTGEEHELFHKLNFNGMLALLLFCSNQMKSLDEKFGSTSTLLTGFFLWLTKTNKALFHSGLINLKGSSLLRRILVDLFENSEIAKLHNSYKKDENTPQDFRTKFNKDGAERNIYLLSCSLRPDANLSNISQNDLIIFLESISKIKVVPALSLEDYSREIIKFSGNKNALKLPKKINVRDYYHQLILKHNISLNTVKHYSTLIEEMIQVTEHRIYEEKISNEYGKNYIVAIIELLLFLQNFSTKLTPDEFKQHFNTIIKDQINFFDWSIKKGREKKFRYNTTIYYLLFDSISSANEYHGLYSKRWVLGANAESKKRKLIRNGFELPIYSTIQEVSFNNPPKTPDMPILTVTPNGEEINMEWWKHKETNPIVAVCNWLVSKMPRRTIHILSLDVDTFLNYREDGSFAGFYINTDKNTNANINSKFIPEFLVKILFTDSEIKFIESYVNYIKQAYSHYTKVEYKSGTNNELIQPLFPDLTKNDIMSKHTLIGFYNKNILKAQFQLRRNAEDGCFNNLYSEEIRDSKINELKNTKLLFINEVRNLVNSYNIPSNEEELESVNYSMGQWRNRFKTEDGMHNMRHAGATNLLHSKGLSLLQIKVITGHTSIDVLTNVYINYNDSLAKLAIRKISRDYGDLHNNPYTASAKIITEKLVPLIESEDPELILEALKDQGLITLKRMIKDRPIDIYGNDRDYAKQDNYIDNGLEIASRFSPSIYEPFNHGICSIGMRCPSETNSVCCMCPHLLFNAVHVEGIIFKLHSTQIHMHSIHEKLRESTQKQELTNIQELRREYNEKVFEMIGWHEMLLEISEQIDNAKESLLSENLPASIKEKAPMEALNLPLEHFVLEFLSEAKQLRVSDLLTDANKAKYILRAFKKASSESDINTLKRIEANGIEWLLESYNSTKREDRTLLVQKYITGDNKNDKEIGSSPI